MTFRKLNRIVRNMVISMLLISGCLTQAAKTAETEEACYNINVSRTNAADAINLLAKQTGAKILFPYEVARKYQTQAVKGCYTVQESLDLLLEGSGITSELSDSGVVVLSFEQSTASDKGGRATGNMTPADEKINGEGKAMIAQNNKHSLLADIAAFFASVVAAPTATGQAQETPFTRSTAAIEEVVVTASKHGESLMQDMSTMINVFTGDSMEDHGVDDFEDFAQFTPGLDFQKSAPVRTQYIIRGLTTSRATTFEPQNRTLVGILVEDIPIDLNGMNPDIDLFDMERVEVLKGPQGSLFGDSSMSGAIRHVLKTPDLQNYSGKLLLSGSTIEDGGESSNFKGAVSIPLVKGSLGARAAVYYRNNGGWVDNHRSGEKNLNTEDTIGGRLVLYWQPTDKFDAKVTFTAQDLETGHLSIEESLVGPSPDGLPRPGLGSFAFARDNLESLDDRFYLWTANLNYDLGWGEITSVTGYEEREIDNHITDNSEDSAMALGLGSLPNRMSFQPWDNERFTQELRIATKLDGWFNVVFGVFYSDQKVEVDTLVTQDGFDDFILNEGDPFGIVSNREEFDALGCAGLKDTQFCGPETDDVEQVAVFGETYWDLTDKLTFIFGGRWFHSDQVLKQRWAGWLNLGPTPVDSDTTADKFLPKVGFDYRINEDILAFFTASKGFRLGGLSSAINKMLCTDDLAALGLAIEDIEAFDPDELWMLEWGVKSSGWFNDRLTVNASLFHTRWSDIQTPINLPCGWSPTFNANKVTGNGVEVQPSIQLTKNLSLRTSITYNDITLDGDAPAVNGMDGDRTPFVPRWSFSLFIDHFIPISPQINGFSSVGVAHRSNSFDTFNREVEIPSQTIVNFRMGAELVNSRAENYTLSFFVDNLTDETIVTNGRIRRNELKRFLGRPRTYGLELAVNF